MPAPFTPDTGDVFEMQILDEHDLIQVREWFKLGLGVGNDDVSVYWAGFSLFETNPSRWTRSDVEGLMEFPTTWRIMIERHMQLSNARARVWFLPAGEWQEHVDAVQGGTIDQDYRYLTKNEVDARFENQGVRLHRLGDTSTRTYNCDFCGGTANATVSVPPRPYDHHGDGSTYYFCDCATQRPTIRCPSYGCHNIQGDPLGSMVRTHCHEHVQSCAGCGVTTPYGRSDDSDTLYCEECWSDRYTTCTSCDATIHHNDVYTIDTEGDGDEDRDYDDEPDYRSYCRRCYTEQVARMERRQLRMDAVSIAVVTLPTPRPVQVVDPYVFSVEIECEFPEGNRPSIGGYHQGVEAETPFFSKWRGESDSSLNSRGGEFISPKLQGTEGVAEVIATFEVLDELEASAQSYRCGQHQHMHDTTDLRMVQAYMTTCEDFMFATTGSWRRWEGSDSYCTRMKQYREYLRPTAENEYGVLPVGSHAAVADKGYGTREFRYPPGTLNRTQFVVNNGLAHLVIRLASEDGGDGSEHYQKAHELLAQETGPYGWVHESVLRGAQVVRDAGWVRGGEWKGLGHVMGINDAVMVEDTEREQTREITFPSEVEIITRIRRQVRGFYSRGSRSHGVWTLADAKVMADEVVSVLTP